MTTNFFLLLSYPAWLILFSILFSLFTSVILKIKTNIKYIYLVSLVSIVAISIISFTYQPSTYTDLFRYYEELNNMRITNTDFYNSHEIVSAFLFKIVANTKHNNFLPFLTSIIRYSLFFWFFWKYVNSESSSSFSIRMFLVFHIAFFPIIEAIAGVRYYLAITFLFAGILSGVLWNKKLYEIIYVVLGLFTHTSSFIYIVLRIMTIKPFYKIIKPFRFLIALWPLAIEYIVLFLTRMGNELTIAAANSLVFYTEESREISARLTLSRAVILFLLIAMYYYIKIYDKKNFRKKESYYNYIELVFIFTISSLQYAVFFQRSIFFLALISMPLVLDFFTSMSVRKEAKKTFAFFLIILSLGMMVNQFYGVLVGYF